MDEKAIVKFINGDIQTELEIPINITANDLIIALNKTYNLGMDIENIFHCYLIAENPIAFLRGNKELSEYGIRNGTRILFKKEQR